MTMVNSGLKGLSSRKTYNKPSDKILITKKAENFVTSAMNFFPLMQINKNWMFILP